MAGGFGDSVTKMFGGDRSNHKNPVVAARSGYDAFKAVEGAAVKELYDYYKGIKKWADVNEEVDGQIMGSFRKLAGSYDPATEVQLWKKISTIWVERSKTIPREEDRRAMVDRINGIDAEAKQGEVEGLSRNMLATYVMARPVPKEVKGAEHLSFFIDGVIKESHMLGSYGGNDEAWWFVYKVYEESWTKTVPSFEAGKFDALRPSQIEIQKEDERIIEEVEKTPPPPPLPHAFRKDFIAPIVVTAPRRRTIEELIRLGGAENRDLEDWISNNLKVVDRSKLDAMTGFEFRVFEARNLFDAEKKARENMSGFKGNENGELQNRIYKSIIGELEHIIKVNKFEQDYARAIQVAMNKVMRVNIEGQREAMLMAAIMVANGKVNDEDRSKYMQYLEARVMAVQHGYTVICDINSMLVIVRAEADTSMIRS